MTLSRRDLLRSGTVLAAGAFLTRRPVVSLERPDVFFDDDVVRGLIMRALDAAKTAGASHAEARVSLLKTWEINEWTGSGWGLSGSVNAGAGGRRQDELAIGVRALAGGSWGFASTSIWTPDEAARIGAEAVTQARTLAQPGSEPVVLAPADIVKDGRWQMPVGRDPFTINRAEVLDTIASTAYFDLRRWAPPAIVVRLIRLESAFGSSEGSYLSQTTWQTGANIIYGVRPKYTKHQYEGPREGGIAYAFPFASKGWEYLGKAAWYEAIRRLNAEQEEYIALPMYSSCSALSRRMASYQAALPRYSQPLLANGKA